MLRWPSCWRRATRWPATSWTGWGLWHQALCAAIKRNVLLSHPPYALFTSDVLAWLASQPGGAWLGAWLARTG